MNSGGRPGLQLYLQVCIDIEDNSVFPLCEELLNAYLFLFRLFLGHTGDVQELLLTVHSEIISGGA